MREQIAPGRFSSPKSGLGGPGLHRGVRLCANGLPVEGLAALAALTTTITVSLLVWGPAY